MPKEIKKPYKPNKPLPSFKRSVIIGYLEDGTAIGDLMRIYGPDAKIRLDHDYDYYDGHKECSFTAEIQSTIVEQNPRYEQELKDYERRLEAYKKALAKYNEDQKNKEAKKLDAEIRAAKELLTKAGFNIND